MTATPNYLSDTYLAVGVYAHEHLNVPLVRDKALREFRAVSDTWSTKTPIEFYERGCQHVDSFRKLDEKVTSKAMADLIIDAYYADCREHQVHKECNCELCQPYNFKRISLKKVLDMAATKSHEFSYPTETHGSVTFVDLDELQDCAVLKIQTDFLPILKKLVPFIFEGNLLCKSTKYTERDGTVSYHYRPLHYLAAVFCNAEGYDFKDGDPLNWTKDNLVRTPLIGDLRDDGGESANHANFRRQNVVQDEHMERHTDSPWYAQSTAPKARDA